jgi:hypothetical protein
MSSADSVGTMDARENGTLGGGRPWYEKLLGYNSGLHFGLLVVLFIYLSIILIIDVNNSGYITKGLGGMLNIPPLLILLVMMGGCGWQWWTSRKSAAPMPVV